VVGKKVELSNPCESDCSHSNAKTFGFKNLQFRDTGASGGPTDRARDVPYWTDELITQDDPVSDGEATLRV